MNKYSNESQFKTLSIVTGQNLQMTGVAVTALLTTLTTLLITINPSQIASLNSRWSLACRCSRKLTDWLIEVVLRLTVFFGSAGAQQHDTTDYALWMIVQLCTNILECSRQLGISNFYVALWHVVKKCGEVVYVASD